jgi:hypothetical protein
MTTRKERIFSLTPPKAPAREALGKAAAIFSGKADASAMMKALTSSTKKKFCSTVASARKMMSAKSASFQSVIEAMILSGSMSSPRSRAALSASSTSVLSWRS